MSNPEEAILSIDTLMHFGLKQQPFSARAPDAFTYTDPALDMPVNAALNFLQSEEQIVALKGEYGIGKSTQIRKLISKARGSMSACLFDANISSGLAAIEHRLRECWQIEDAPDDLDEFITRVKECGIRPTLIIDNTQDLDIDVLEQILTLRRNQADNGSIRFGLLLVGESTLEHTLSELEADFPELSQSHSLILRPLTKEQTAAYIDHRLRIAGMYVPNPFTNEDIESVVAESNGLPASINHAANTILEAHGAEVSRKDQQNRPGWLRENRVPIIIATVAALALILIYLLLQGLFFSQPPQKTSDRAIETIKLPPPAAEHKEQNAPPTEIAPEPELIAPLPVAAASEPAEIKPVEEPPLPEATNTSQKTETEIESKPVADTASSEPLEGQPAEETSQDRPETRTPVQSPASMELKDSKWILGLNNDQFITQLLALSSRDAIVKAASELELQDTLAYYEREKNGKNLYILIAGPYPDRASAENAILNYPTSLRNSKPWIRSVKDIKDIIYAQ
jgi:DamX protein